MPCVPPCAEYTPRVMSSPFVLNISGRRMHSSRMVCCSLVETRTKVLRTLPEEHGVPRTPAPFPSKH